jgi:hypothetical protein
MDNTLDPLVLLVQADENLNLALDDQFIVPLGDHLLKARILVISDSQELASDAVLLPVADSAHVESIEELYEILEAHPKGAVGVVKHWVYLPLHVLCPERRGITPVSIPFELTPRVPDVYQLMTKSLLNLDYTVGMARD